MKATELLEKLNFNEMASYRTEDTGLPMICIILGKNDRHEPRVKFQQDYSKNLNFNNTCSITISDNPAIPDKQKWKLTPEDFNLAKEFIILNKEILLKYWHLSLLTRDLETSMKKITK